MLLAPFVRHIGDVSERSGRLRSRLVMRASFLRRCNRRRFAALLWIALLMPLAQSAAMWHTVSHARADAAAGIDDRMQALHHAQCVLCLAGEALTSGAIDGLVPTHPHTTALHAVPVTVPLRSRVAPTERPYQSRAPPFAPY